VFLTLTLIGLPTDVVQFTCDINSNCTDVSLASSPGNKCFNPPRCVNNLRNEKKGSLPLLLLLLVAEEEDDEEEEEGS
jgi:hypothetical protein